SSDTEYRVVGFVDDDPERQGTVVAGLSVYAPERILQLVNARRISNILLALPSASGRRKGEIMQRLESLPVSVKTIPTLDEILAGRARMDEVRDIDVEDLLGRD